MKKLFITCWVKNIKINNDYNCCDHNPNDVGRDKLSLVVLQFWKNQIKPEFGSWSCYQLQKYAWEWKSKLNENFSAFHFEKLLYMNVWITTKIIEKRQKIMIKYAKIFYKLLRNFMSNQDVYV